MSIHLAAVSTANGQRFETQSRPTPKSGPGELLIAVKSVALNPADHLMRDQGLLISKYPTVVGFDISGLVIEIGDDVPTNNNANGSDVSFQPGITRVAAYAAFFWRSCNSDYGAFQQRCLVPWQHAVPFPDEKISWNLAATLPVAVQVPLCAWDALQIPRMGLVADHVSGVHTSRSAEMAERKNDNKREALLIWGASSSVGTMGVQSARLLRDDPNSIFAAVYATAGSANLGCVKSLGADRVFDHRDPHVVEAIISAAKEDGLTVRHCFLAVGQLSLCQAVLQAFLEPGKGEDRKSKIASAPPVFPDAGMVDGVDVIFLQPSTDEEARLEQFRYWMGTWLEEALSKGLIEPSPKLKVVGRGLEAINVGLDMLVQGVSCTKLVVEIEE